MSTSTQQNKIEEDSATALTRKKTVIQNLAKFENTIKKAWVEHHQKLCHQKGEK
jgi:hypothetical protein